MRSRVDQIVPSDVPRSAVARELVRAHEIAQILDALAECQVFPILLKGAALAYTVYPSPPMRPRVDTDLLIPRDHLAIVRDVLSRRGYVEPAMSDGELLFGQLPMVRIDAFDVEHVFDIHWKISSQTLFANVLTYDELRADAIPVPALGAHARTASRSHALLLACIHPVMHHRNTDRPIWLYDIDLLVRHLSIEELRWFTRLAVNKAMSSICARQLLMASQRFDTPVPADIMQVLASPRAEPATVYLRPHRRWHHELLWNVRNLQRWGDRLRLLREIFFPSAKYMLDSYHLGSGGLFLLPALYVHRCAHGVFRILTGRK
jgi:hypothetical protein